MRYTSKVYLSYIRIIKYCRNRLHNFITINHFHLTHGTVGMYNKAFHTLISQNNFYRGFTMHSLISRLNFIQVKRTKKEFSGRDNHIACLNYTHLSRCQVICVANDMTQCPYFYLISIG